MAQSLKAKFNGIETEVVNHAKAFGASSAMRRYGVKDHLAFTKFLAENGVDISNGLVPGEDVIAKVVGEFTKHLLAFRDEIARLRSENAELRKIAETKKVQQRLHEESAALDFLNFCNSPIPDIDDDILGVPVEV